MTIHKTQGEGSPTGEASSGGVRVAFLAALLGLAITMVFLPVILPGLMESLSGEKPKVFWFLSRGLGIISYVFLWLSMILGLLITGKVARFFPGAFTANDLHQYVSITGLVSGITHGIILVGDKFMDTNLTQILVPFAYVNYRPTWVALGQIGFYFWLVTVITFYLKKRIGYKAWRVTHYLSFLTFAGVLIHGLMSGTDSSSVWISAFYWISGGSVFFLTLYRILALGEGHAATAVSRPAEARSLRTDPATVPVTLEQK